MKKLTIVLLALLLIGGMAFADITLTGEASLALQYDLDADEFGMVNGTDTADAEFSFTLDTADASAMGDADVYAVIEMSGSIDVDIDGQDLDEDDVILGDDETGDEISSSVSIDTAKIVGENWEVSILGMDDSLNMATDFQDRDGSDEVDSDDNVVSGAFGTGDGASLTYEDYTVGAFYYDGAYAAYLGTSMEVADGVTVGLGLGFDGAADVSAELAYDMDGTAVTVAVDTADNFADMDVSLATTLDMDGTAVTLDGYFFNDTVAGTDLAVEAGLTLDAVALTVTGSTLITGWDLAVEASTDLNDEIALTVDGSFDNANAWSAGASAVYTVEDYTVTLGGGYTSAGVIDLTATIENTTLIDGATLYLGYEADDFTDVGADATDAKGVVAASVTIAL